MWYLAYIFFGATMYCKFTVFLFKISTLNHFVHLFRKMSTTSGPSLDAPSSRPRKASVASRKLSARMDSEVADAFRLFDTVRIL